MIFAAYSPGERASRLPAVGSVGVSDATRRAVMLSSQDDAGRSGGMADATVSKTVGPQGSCGFDSHLRHHKRSLTGAARTDFDVLVDAEADDTDARPTRESPTSSPARRGRERSVRCRLFPR